MMTRDKERHRQLRPKKEENHREKVRQSRDSKRQEKEGKQRKGVISVELFSIPATEPVHHKQIFAATARQKGKQVGLAVGTIEPKTADIDYFVIDKGARGQGLGSKVVPEVERTLKAKGVEQVSLTDASIRTTGKTPFWRRLGYEGEVKKSPDMQQHRWKLIAREKQYRPTLASVKRAENLKPRFDEAGVAYFRANLEANIRSRTKRDPKTKDIFRRINSDLKATRRQKRYHGYSPGILAEDLLDIYNTWDLAHKADPDLYPDVNPLFRKKEIQEMKKITRRKEWEEARATTRVLDIIRKKKKI